MATFNAPRCIAFEGMIGVGKTSLVERLAPLFGGRSVLETFDENPFLDNFYRDRSAYAFQTQIFFLMARFRQQEALAQGDLFRSVALSDYLFDKDRIFAELNLRSQELLLYDRLFAVLRAQVPSPDLVVYLRADIDVILRRIVGRDRPYERAIDPEYIQALGAAYENFFAEYSACPVLRIDSTDLDPCSEETIQALASAIKGGGGISAWAGHRNRGQGVLLLPGLG